MTNKEINHTIGEVAFSMEMEGFEINDEQKDVWRKILMGEIDANAQIQKYIETARSYGEPE